MGFFSKLFNRNKESNENSTANNADVETSAVPEEKFVDNTPPTVEERKDIDLIYKFINTDFEEKGYRDALINIDGQQRKLGLECIEGQLIGLIRQARLTYEKEIQRLNYDIDCLTRAGMLDIKEQREAEKTLREENLVKLNEMEKDYRDEQVYMRVMMKTYEKGFDRGVVATLLTEKPKQ